MDTNQPVNALVTRRFDVSPQQVFNAWIDPHTAEKWLFAAGRADCVEIDARARGWFYIAGRRNGTSVEYVGEYLEVVRPHRLVFALLAEKYSLNFELVTVLFNARGIGCELSLTHETKPEFAQQVRSDWIKLLERLAALFDESAQSRARVMAVPGVDPGIVPAIHALAGEGKDMDARDKPARDGRESDLITRP